MIFMGARIFLMKSLEKCLFDTFSDFFGFRAWRARETPVAHQRARNKRTSVGQCPLKGGFSKRGFDAMVS